MPANKRSPELNGPAPQSVEDLEESYTGTFDLAPGDLYEYVQLILSDYEITIEEAWEDRPRPRARRGRPPGKTKKIDPGQVKTMLLNHIKDKMRRGRPTTRADIAKRIGVSPATVQRWLDLCGTTIVELRKLAQESLQKN